VTERPENPSRSDHFGGGQAFGRSDGGRAVVAGDERKHLMAPPSGAAVRRNGVGVDVISSDAEAG
jgi:hypothetical protein